MQVRVCAEPLFSYVADRPDGSRLFLDQNAPHWMERSLSLVGEITERLLELAVDRGSAPTAALHVIAVMVPAAALACGKAAIESGLDPSAGTSAIVDFIAGAIRATRNP